MLKDLIKFANHLDSKGLTKEADMVDSIIKKIAQEGEAYGEYNHTVKEGETVEGIARHYGVNPGSELYRKTIEENFKGNTYEEKLSDADLIFPGDLIRVFMPAAKYDEMGLAHSNEGMMPEID